MHLQVKDAGFYIFWYRLWIVLGASCIAGGTYLLIFAQSHPGPTLDKLYIAALVTIAFGILRIGNCLYLLRKIRRRPLFIKE